MRYVPPCGGALAPSEEPDAEAYDSMDGACNNGLKVAAWEAAQIAAEAIAKLEGAR